MHQEVEKMVIELWFAETYRLFQVDILDTYVETCVYIYMHADVYHMEHMTRGHGRGGETPQSGNTSPWHKPLGSAAAA